MWKFIKILLCAMVFGLFVTQLSASVPGKITVAQEQTYQGSDQGVPVQMALINYAIEQKNSKIENPDYLLPWANDEAKTLVPMIAEVPQLDNRCVPYWQKLSDSNNIKSTGYNKKIASNFAIYKNLHHDFG